VSRSQVLGKAFYYIQFERDSLSGSDRQLTFMLLSNLDWARGFQNSNKIKLDWLMWHSLKYMGLKRLRMCSEFVYKMWGNHKELKLVWHGSRLAFEPCYSPKSISEHRNARVENAINFSSCHLHIYVFCSVNLKPHHVNHTLIFNKVVFSNKYNNRCKLL
jgi:hypothetical protein